MFGPFGFEKCPVFFENDPNVHIGFQQLLGFANRDVHVEQVAVLKPHALRQTGIAVVEVFVSMKCDVGEPPHLLVALSTEDDEFLIADVHVDF